MLFTTEKTSRKHPDKNFGQLKFGASGRHGCGGWITSRSTIIVQ